MRLVWFWNQGKICDHRRKPRTQQGFKKPATTLLPHLCKTPGIRFVCELRCLLSARKNERGSHLWPEFSGSQAALVATAVNIFASLLLPSIRTVCMDLLNTGCLMRTCYEIDIMPYRCFALCFLLTILPIYTSCLHFTGSVTGPERLMNLPRAPNG